MKYVAAYLLAQLSQESPSADDVRSVLATVDCVVDEAALADLMSRLHGKDAAALLAEGAELLASACRRRRQRLRLLRALRFRMVTPTATLPRVTSTPCFSRQPVYDQAGRCCACASCCRPCAASVSTPAPLSLGGCHGCDPLPVAVCCFACFPLSCIGTRAVRLSCRHESSFCSDVWC